MSLADKIDGFNILEKSLAASAIRHQVISDNIANVNTPGFKRSAVSFEDELARQLYADKSKASDNKTKLDLTLTHKKHLDIKKNITTKPSLDPLVQLVDDNYMRVDGNNVDIDRENALMAKNNIYYQAVAKQISGYITGMQSVIQGGR